MNRSLFYVRIPFLRMALLVMLLLGMLVVTVSQKTQTAHASGGNPPGYVWSINCNGYQGVLAFETISYLWNDYENVFDAPY
ncbi:hypothetical protein KSC_108250 [Ktedonobacter sp. SOSP1-52]|uniref:hypothetical protein n=1 Tax=Ktedonobacter sp. SOSP1-52 TaxID=2778366 RepID=UPI001915121A|nr:hypothetical protein [Ktedonobacter sp. SOSP1-52]GHO71933.1 hypothetical protein KSC_108250 [Ktedonobacter sp. SOSP1-52]